MSIDGRAARIVGPARRAAVEVQAIAALTRAGVFGLDPPRTVRAIVAAMRELGPFAAAPRLAALRHGDRAAIADERGSLSFVELDDRVARLAAGLHARDLGPGQSLGILCRNHRTPLIAAFAASRLGMNTVWLNTGFSPRQAREVVEREGVDLLVHDDDLAGLVTDVSPPHGRLVCSVDDPTADEVDRLIIGAPAIAVPVPPRPGRVVLLTSGTTGTPKGAPRTEPRSFTLAGGVLARMPMRAHEATVIAPPMYHGTGLMITLVSFALGSTIVVRRRFDPERLLDDIAAHRATAICVVPVMLQRMLALGEEEIRRRDLSSLRVVFSAGSQLPATVALRTMDLLGEVVYNLYGSTEVSVATLATPADVRAAPTSVGRPTLGVRLRLLDEHGKEVPRGSIGRIFVGTTSPFEGYTGGGGKEIVDGMLSTGDVGHLDERGRLYIDGRDDEMIVSGGENVFPREIEELLVTHHGIADAAAIGVEDAEFGQRLRAFVVLRPGATLGAEEVRTFVRDNLARYKVPRDVVFLEELPRNPTGKILKRELASTAG